MAASNTVTNIKKLANGMIMEEGTFDLSTDTELTITAASGDSSYDAPYVSIEEVLWSDFYSDGDNAIAKAKDTYPNQVKITGTQADTGDYKLFGFAR
jgi:hypothetical protein